MKNNLSQLASRLKGVRRFRGLTQEAVANQLPVNYRHLQKIEGGKADFKLSTLHRLASLYRLEPCFLANTESTSLFQLLALPCQSLLLDALPLGVLVLNGGETLFANRRYKEILEHARMRSPRLADALGEELLARARTVQSGARKWTFTLTAGGGALAFTAEALVSTTTGGRLQIEFLVECPAYPVSRKPLGLQRRADEDFLTVPARNMRCYRGRKKMTQAEAAAALDMNLRYYQKLESGKLDIKCSTLEKIAKTYDVHPCQLLVEESLRPYCADRHACIRDLLDTLGYGVVAITATGEVAYANGAYNRTIGLSENIEGKHYWDLLPTEAERQPARERIQKTFAELPEPDVVRREIPRPAGSSQRLIVHWDYLASEDGRVIGAVALTRNELKAEA
jgi:PAS domain S-box-containing protein